jgi:hypothetical protein
VPAVWPVGAEADRVKMGHPARAASI